MGVVFAFVLQLFLYRFIEEFQSSHHKNLGSVVSFAAALNNLGIFANTVSPFADSLFHFFASLSQSILLSGNVDPCTL